MICCSTSLKLCWWWPDMQSEVFWTEAAEVLTLIFCLHFCEMILPLPQGEWITKHLCRNPDLWCPNSSTACVCPALSDLHQHTSAYSSCHIVVLIFRNSPALPSRPKCGVAGSWRTRGFWWWLRWWNHDAILLLLFSEGMWQTSSPFVLKYFIISCYLMKLFPAVFDIAALLTKWQYYSCLMCCKLTLQWPVMATRWQPGGRGNERLSAWMRFETQSIFDDLQQWSYLAWEKPSSQASHCFIQIPLWWRVQLIHLSGA